jgi:hypothetical protein
MGGEGARDDHMGIRILVSMDCWFAKDELEIVAHTKLRAPNVILRAPTLNSLTNVH